MTQRSLWLVLGVLVGGLAFSPAALAQDEEDPEPEVSTPAPSDAMWDRVLAVSVTAGIDTPFGIGGAAIEVTPFRYLAIYAGGGVGRDGARFAGGVRPQFPIGNGALGIMLGVTGGPLDWDSRGNEDVRVHRYWEMALFLHTGLSFEYRWAEGFFGRLEFGIEALLTPTEATVCSQGNGNSCLDDSLVTPIRGWAGLSVGYAFDL